MTRRYTLYVEVSEINPPIGQSLHYAAKAHIRGPDGRTFVIEECWGCDAQEAEARAKRAAEAWIVSHSG
ncbi:hypothetical protein [Sabulicella rubraurantiaca]|uniref:hypothetical protein n=1 Tax=Sabulicella rubraurantiaca TaxID=2811429 RepID=UPI001A977F3D|nr:hypothetical protein [Sabulicella rubraurantiaca]